ncbi:hypothetical protein C7H19_04780 [Aphanothece hegewaldii CCALA 016]|uniref:DUF1501 domain-containing protein n=1 Tax=Aphanothece hegewaldii CCALA 016 TaxID=2107694 RepID=A0A2T1M0T3_9CHRO|nr:DUF1501 domain-containing protein [Aphanothece hegewaldii]PSF38313.1 hypothetical protein C7H19_04780 [Aphanothece hegewaldii CCALA 016]
MDRRRFLIRAGYFSASAIATLSTHYWLTPATASSNNPKRLIVIFLRGAVDGLNVVVPYQEAAYYEARRSIAIPQPDQENGALNLDGQFGLHPALAPLLPLWQQKSLAFVHACGSTNETRSHFDAQDYMESGTPGVKRTSDGWMNRLLENLSGHTPIQGVSVGSTIPRIFSGKMSVATIASGKNATRTLLLDRPQIGAAFDRLYSNNDTLSRVYQEGRAARQALQQDLDNEMKMANNGAPLPNGFVSDAQRVANVMVKDPRVQLVFMALGGWDTHVNQGSTQGQLARNLQALGQGLATLQKSLGAVYQNTTILVMSEFGRTVQENGNGGTDHGHGNVMWVLGGTTKGGKVYGQWTGLDNSQLYQGRDLPVTTDFRDVVTTVLERHLGLEDSKLAQVFPNYSPKQRINLI